MREERPQLVELGLDLAATAALTTDNYFRFFAKALTSG